MRRLFIDAIEKGEDLPSVYCKAVAAATAQYRGTLSRLNRELTTAIMLKDAFNCSSINSGTKHWVKEFIEKNTKSKCEDVDPTEPIPEIGGD